MTSFGRTVARRRFAPATTRVISVRRDLDLPRGLAVPPGPQTMNDILNARILCSQSQGLDGCWKLVTPQIPVSQLRPLPHSLPPCLTWANGCGVIMEQFWVLPCLFEVRLQIGVYLKCLDRNDQKVLRTSYRRNVKINPSRPSWLIWPISWPCKAVKLCDEPDGPGRTAKVK